MLSTAHNQADKVRLIAVTSPCSGAFLNARPCASLGIRLDNFSLRNAIALRIGAPVCLPHTCICGQQVDSLGHYGLSCKNSAGRFSRLCTVNDIIKRALLSAEIPSRLKPKSLLSKNISDQKRPDGLTLIQWKDDRCLKWDDFTCPDTLAPSRLNLASTGIAAIANDAEDRKRNK